MDRDQVLLLLRQQLPHLKKDYGVKKVAIFGSFAKQTASPTSDVDILVELSRPLGLEFIRLADELEETLHRRVDLSTFESLKRTAANPRRKQKAADIIRTLVYT